MTLLTEAGILTAVLGVVAFVVKVLLGTKGETEKVAAAKQEFKDAVARIDNTHGNEAHRAELLRDTRVERDDKGK